jgi:uncharacterized protein YjiS (DUF1127 family)
MSSMTHIMVTECQVGLHSSSSHRVGVAGRIGELFSTWYRRTQERDAFAHLDQRDLRDMGLSQWEVETELAKPFWRE